MNVAQQTTIAGKTVFLDEEGFFLFPDQWIAAMAPGLAREEGIVELTDRHWQVIRLMRAEYEEMGTCRALRMLSELDELFPHDPATVAARIAGIPKPREA